MLIGGLEGLPHEFKYKEQPRQALPEFTFLEQGARSDDDNDIEWMHLWFMDREGGEYWRSGGTVGTGGA